MGNTFKPDNIAKHNALLHYSVFVSGRRDVIATKKDPCDEAHCQYMEKQAMVRLTNVLDKLYDIYDITIPHDAYVHVRIHQLPCIELRGGFCTHGQKINTGTTRIFVFSLL